MNMSYNHLTVRAHICLRSGLLIMGIEYVKVVPIKVKLILNVKWDGQGIGFIYIFDYLVG